MRTLLVLALFVTVVAAAEPTTEELMAVRAQFGGRAAFIVFLCWPTVETLAQRKIVSNVASDPVPRVQGACVAELRSQEETNHGYLEAFLASFERNRDDNLVIHALNRARILW